MTEAVIVALISGGLTALCTIVTVVFNNSKTLYRIEQLEKKVEKHNQVVERLAIMEESEKAQWKWIDELKEHRV